MHSIAGLDISGNEKFDNFRDHEFPSRDDAEQIAVKENFKTFSNRYLLSFPCTALENSSRKVAINNNMRVRRSNKKSTKEGRNWQHTKHQIEENEKSLKERSGKRYRMTQHKRWWQLSI